MLLAENTPPIPAYNLICTVDPRSAIANGRPATKGIKTSARFTLTMAKGAIPITISPRNLAAPPDNITHLHQNEPRRVGDLVHYPIRYQQPLFPPSETLTLKEANDFAHIQITGQLVIDPMQMRFQLQQTMSIHMNPSVPITERKDLQLQLSGTCVERAINPQA